MIDRKEKKKKNTVAIVATMSIEQTKLALQQLFKTLKKKKIKDKG